MTLSLAFLTPDFLVELRGFELWTPEFTSGIFSRAVQAVAGFHLPLHGLFDLRMAITQIIRAPGAHEIDGAAAVDVHERRAFAACEELGITLGKVRGVQMPHIPPGTTLSARWWRSASL
jgi:hypothetical protein